MDCLSKKKEKKKKKKKKKRDLMNIHEYANEIRIESGKAMSKLWFGTIFLNLY